jgi:putative molybdopterin biosynthesis protein
MVAGGNPKGVRDLSDLVQAGVRFVNRNPGSGTRLWLDTNLRSRNIPTGNIKGYNRIVKTHTEAAALVQSGRADVAIGLQAAAHQKGLGFIQLFEERYDLILPREQERTLSPLLDYLQTSGFRDALSSLTGYNSAHSGEQIPF